MSRGVTRNLTDRITDLEGALKAIGRILVDTTVTPKQRIAQSSGVLRMYDALPTTNPEPAAAQRAVEN